MNVKKHGQENENPEPIRVAIYARGPFGNRGRSVDAQADLLERFAARKRSAGPAWALSRRFVEGPRGGRR